MGLGAFLALFGASEFDLFGKWRREMVNKHQTGGYCLDLSYNRKIKEAEFKI